MKRETVGKISSDLLQKAPESRDPIEIQREMQEDYLDNLIQCVNAHKKELQSDFYVVVLTKKERLMPNVYRNYFFARLSCPTPDYDQAVYRYDYKKEELEYLWCIPSRDTSILLRDNALQVAPEEQGLLKHVLDFADGTLFKLAKKLNKECADSPLIES